MSKPRFLLTSCLILAASLAGCGPTEGELVQTEAALTPSPSPLTIDGTILPGEWSLADSHTMPGGSDLYLLREGDLLYLAVSGSRPGVLGANIFLYEGDQVRILHISAALGTAEYVLEDEGWSLARNFEWEHRTLGNTAAALDERQGYFEREGWSAPNALTGTANHLEMQIRLEPDTRLAISLLGSSTTVPFVWPPGLEDDTGKTFPDGLEPVIHLAPENWYLVP